MIRRRFFLGLLGGGLVLSGVVSVAADDWPQWRGPDRDGVWKEQGIIQKFSGERVPLCWRTPIASGYSGPTVAEGRVYVTDRLADPKQVERVHCFDWKTGRSLWTYTYDCPYEDVSYTDGPRAAVSIAAGRAYALGTMGHLHCFDATTGKVLWKRDLNKEYKIRMPIWGIAAAPLVDEDRLILQVGGSEGACCVALECQTGVERWRAIDDNASYSAPVITTQAGRRVLICLTGDHVVGLDPVVGKVHWQHPFEPVHGMVIGVATPVIHQNFLLVTSFYDGSLMLRLRSDALGVEEIWRQVGANERNTKALHSTISTPCFSSDYVYGVDSYGQLRCLQAKTGDRIWEDLKAVPPARWATIHMVRNDGRVWMFNERGELLITRLSPRGFEEISRAKLIEPSKGQLASRGGVCWAHPAYAYKHVFVRNDHELVCASLAAEE